MKRCYPNGDAKNWITCRKQCVMQKSFLKNHFLYRSDWMLCFLTGKFVVYD